MTRTLGPCPNSFRCPLPYSKAGWGVPLCRRRCHHPGLTLTSGKRRRGARAVFGGAQGDRKESVSTPPFPTAYFSTATSLRHGKPLLFAGSRVERLSQGSKLLPGCLRVRRDFTVLSAALRPDLDSRWWVPYFSMSGSASLPGTCFLQIRGTSERGGPASTCGPGASAGGGSLLLSSPDSQSVLITGAGCTHIHTQRPPSPTSSTPPPSPSPTAPEPSAGFARRGSRALRLPRRGQEGEGIWRRALGGGNRQTELQFGPETVYLSVTSASSEPRGCRAGRSLRCPARAGAGLPAM